MSCLASHRAAAWINVGLAVILVLHASPTEAGSPAPERHVYMLRGAGGIRYWPRGDLLIRRLQAAGFSVDDFSSSEVLRMAELVRCRHRTGQQQGPLVFLGYSSGGDSACRVAKRLQRDGIVVGHLILIESTLGVPVPGNVNYCLNLYKSDPDRDWIPALRGIAIEQQSPLTQLRNIDVRYDPNWHWLIDTRHLTMPASDRMQETLVGFVRQIHAGEPCP